MYAYAISGKKPGRNWHYCYGARNPVLKLKKPQSLDPKRAMNFNKHTVQDYFEKQRQINETFNGIPPEHKWNMDEKGIQMGGGRKNSGSKFYFDRTKKDVYRVSSDNLELITVIECILAAGICMKPSFILKDGPFPDVRGLESIGSISRTPNGWTDHDICERWFSDVFIPEASSRRVNNKPIVLTLDGHSSHEQPAIQKIAYNNNIIIFCFPSKTTHKLQPLDVIVFSPVQRKW
ncbi:hypothetical protein SERLADRAFT_352940, partial [Serpula lacrymans var. lacrymans S7.9]